MVLFVSIQAPVSSQSAMSLAAQSCSSTNGGADHVYESSAAINHEALTKLMNQVFDLIVYLCFFVLHVILMQCVGAQPI